MTREKKKAPAPSHGVAAAARRAKMERASQYSDTVWRNLNPLKAPPKVKHRSYFEAVNNTDKKKKKLEFEITTDRQPPPGFEFIPTGHPELSQECKEQSRDKEAMFFIVSNSKDTLKLDHHMNRLGYHFRHSIVEEARKVLNERGHHDLAAYVHEPGKPEPIPNSQREIDQEADAVLRDLFPRIPNTDRQQIIDHAFKKDGMFNGEFKVGMAKDITLARRVQLAALAHIRHTHTRYDELLKESDWANARKAVEKPCLDIIVKWRGDEETGRDQLDEILREVIEISDSESDSEDEGNSAGDVRIRTRLPRSPMMPISNGVVSRLSRAPNYQPGVDSRTSSPILAAPPTPATLHRAKRAEQRTVRKTQQRFKRYAAAAEALANSNQNGHQENTPGFVATPMEAAGRQGSAHPVDSYHHRSSAVVHETYIPNISDRYTELRRIPVQSAHGNDHARKTGMPRDSSNAHIHGGLEQFIRVPDAQRPKVGPYSANHSHLPPPPPLSPVRLGLQDMLLPSIEPRSPPSPRVLRDGSHRMRCETQQPAKVSRTISHTLVKPVAPRSRPQSPSTVVDDDGLALKRRRVTTYFPEDFQNTAGSFVRAAPQNQEDVLRRPQFDHLAERHPPTSRVSERVIYRDIPLTTSGREVLLTRPEDNLGRSRTNLIPVAGDERFSMGLRAPDRAPYRSDMPAPIHQVHPVNRTEVPLSSRAHPIVIDADDYESRRIIEVRRSPAHEVYTTSSPQTINIRNSQLQGDSRMRDSSGLIYVDESASGLGNDPSQHRRLLPRFQLRQPTNMPLQPQSRAFERPSHSAVPHGREVISSSTLERIPLGRPSDPSGLNQAPFPVAPRPERFARSQHDYRSSPDAGAVQQAMPQQPRDNVIYREIRPGIARPAGTGYEQGLQQPFPIYPAPSSYAEIRGPPSHRRIPDHRDMIYVE